MHHVFVLISTVDFHASTGVCQRIPAYEQLIAGVLNVPETYLGRMSAYVQRIQRMNSVCHICRHTSPYVQMFWVCWKLNFDPVVCLSTPRKTGVYQRIQAYEKRIASVLKLTSDVCWRIPTFLQKSSYVSIRRLKTASVTAP